MEINRKVELLERIVRAIVARAKIEGLPDNIVRQWPGVDDLIAELDADREERT